MLSLCIITYSEDTVTVIVITCVNVWGTTLPLPPRHTGPGAHPATYKMGKGKAVPLQAWSGPEGSRKLRFQDFMTTAEDGGKVVSPTHRPPLPPENAPGTHFC